VNVLQKGPIASFGLCPVGYDMSPEKRGTQSVTAHGTVNMYVYSLRYPVRDEGGFLAYGCRGVVLRIQTFGVDRADLVRHEMEVGETECD